MTEQLTRRYFLKRGCLTAAAVGITVCGGVTVAATYQPQVYLPALTYGEEAVNERVLVTYATKAGSTAEVAAKIGEVLAEQNFTVDVLPVAEVGDLTPYRVVVAGSAIRIGQVLPEMMAFIEKHQDTLHQKAFCPFVLCMTLTEENAESRKTVSTYLEPVRLLVKPATEGMFAGVMNPSKLSLLDRLMAKMVKTPVGDFRNWEQITSWAKTIPNVA